MVVGKKLGLSGKGITGTNKRKKERKMKNKRIRVCAIDPGIIDTGVSCIEIARSINDGGWKILENQSWVYDPSKNQTVPWANIHIIEDGNRQGINSVLKNKINKLHAEIPYVLTPVNNSGIKKLVTDDMLKALNLWDEQEKTHHKDIRSARRLALFWIIKQKEWNSILAQILASAVEKKEIK